MRIDQLISKLKTLAAQHGQDTPVYTNGEPHLIEAEVSGIRMHKAEECESMDGIDCETMPERVYLKV